MQSLSRARSGVSSSARHAEALGMYFHDAHTVCYLAFSGSSRAKSLPGANLQHLLCQLFVQFVTALV